MIRNEPRRPPGTTALVVETVRPPMLAGALLMLPMKGVTPLTERFSVPPRSRKLKVTCLGLKGRAKKWKRIEMLFSLNERPGEKRTGAVSIRAKPKAVAPPAVMKFSTLPIKLLENNTAVPGVCPTGVPYTVPFCKGGSNVIQADAAFADGGTARRLAISEAETARGTTL